MQISYNWLKELVDFNYNPQELDYILTMLGIEVESITDYGKKYDRFTVSEVIKAEKHPDADKLSVCIINNGKEELQVICGAPNVAAGQKVVFAEIGAVVPSSGIRIEKRKIRGVESNGMICSAAELEISSDAGGIVVLPADATVGIAFKEYMNFNDIILEISVTPNRAECLSHFGIAREIASYTGQPFRKPEITINDIGPDTANSIKVIIEDEDKCPRYTARIVRGVNVVESPLWMKNRLTMLGMRPINAVVDITNYVLLECGQPLHAFDLDQLEDSTIIVKTAGDGEKFVTLDSKERILDSGMLMICDGKKPVAIGGVMGGENSEITDKTKDILIESAFFKPSSVRRTSKKLGILSESSYRFERGVDIENVEWASARAAQLIASITGGITGSGVIDCYPGRQDRKKCRLRFDRARKIIGIDLNNDEITSLLKRLHFGITGRDDEGITVEVPSFRVDIFEEIDLIEEVARLYNYDKIDPNFTSSIDFSGEKVPQKLAAPPLKKQIRQYLTSKGFHEILNQNITDPKLVAVSTDEPIRISNPLGEELSVMRASLIPSMLQTIRRNIAFGNRDLRLFEIGKTFHHTDYSAETFINGILETEEIAIAISGVASPGNWSIHSPESDFYTIKGIFEDFAGYFKLGDIIGLSTGNTENKFFSANSLQVIIDGKVSGALGELSPGYLKQFDIEIPVYIIVIGMKALYGIRRPQPKYKPVPPYPGITRDLAFIVEDSIPSKQLSDAIKNNGGELLKKVEIFDVYKGKNISGGKKSIAFSLYFASDNRTLTEPEIEKGINDVVNYFAKTFNAELRKF